MLSIGTEVYNKFVKTIKETDLIFKLDDENEIKDFEVVNVKLHEDGDEYFGSDDENDDREKDEDDNGDEDDNSDNESYCWTEMCERESRCRFGFW